ncbi:MAG: YbfB/YjiJ family MFS transporter [Rhizobiaceae bacterium]
MTKPNTETHGDEAIALAPTSGENRQAILRVVALAIAPAIGLGIARFAYALVLPDMRADLGWSYSDAGWMNTTNAAGYLLGALLASRAIATAGAFRVMVVGVWACIAALLFSAAVRNGVLLNGGRFFAGLGGGFAFVAGGVLAAGIAQRNPDRAAFLLGLFYAGAGLGILLSGLSAPYVLERYGPGSWNIAWAALAVLSMPLAIGLHRARGERAIIWSTAQVRPSYGKMGWLLCAYFFFGAGYIVYMTFMIAWVQGTGGSVGFQALFWAAIGLAVMVSPWLWAGVIKRLLHGYAFAALAAVTTIGSSLPLLSTTVPVLLASAVVFGSAFFAVVAATTAFARRNLPQAQWAAGIGMLTVAFGIGQMLGPVAVGFLNDVTEGLTSGLLASTILLVAAVVIGGIQRDFKPPKKR